VTVEGSRDRSQASMVPLCAPVSTSGLTTIKIQLLRHEIVTVVTIRLHKPRDSQTIGLSQIMLMGYMAFGDLTGAVASRIANIFTPMEDYVSRTGYVVICALVTALCDISDITKSREMSYLPLHLLYLADSLAVFCKKMITL